METVDKIASPNFILPQLFKKSSLNWQKIAQKQSVQLNEVSQTEHIHASSNQIKQQNIISIPETLHLIPLIPNLNDWKQSSYTLKKREGAEQDKRERDRMSRKKKDQRILVIHLQITKIWLGGKKAKEKPAQITQPHISKIRKASEISSLKIRLWHVHYIPNSAQITYKE